MPISETYTPTPARAVSTAKLSGLNTAEQCRLLGLKVGDTIEGRERCGTYWNEARLTLLWAGEEVAVFRVTERSSERPEWSQPEESGDWTLECRKWRKLPPAPQITG